VDSRNGARVTFAAVPLARFTLPKRSDGRPYDVRTRRMWVSLWADSRLSSVLSPVDRELVIRWAVSVDDWIKAREKALADPVAKGSMGQEVPAPWFSIAKQAEATVAECERQIGIGALNRARLGIALISEARGLAELSGAFPGKKGDDDDDPRLG
jgi:hypothetical protein